MDDLREGNAPGSTASRKELQGLTKTTVAQDQRARLNGTPKLKQESSRSLSRARCYSNQHPAG